MPSDKLKLFERKPTVNEYCMLRAEAGLSQKSAEAASRGLAGTLHAVVLEDEGGSAVGMGRVIGDGGCFFDIVDICVLPSFQKKGHGQTIMSALMSWLKTNAPSTAVVSLLADGTAYKLYEKFGFTMAAPASQGMIFKIK